MKAVFFCLAILLLALPSLAQSGAEIVKMNFIGNDHFSDDHLRELVKNHHISRLSKLFTGDEPLVYDEETVADDIRFIIDFYQREGFLACEVAPPRVDYDRRKDEVVLTISIAEGAPMRVKGMGFDIQGVRESEYELLLEEIHKLTDETELVETGERFDDSNVVIFQDSLRRLFSYYGYPYASPEFDLTADTIAWDAYVAWRIDPGPYTVFGGTTIEGNKEITTGLISGMAAYKEGQRYDQRLVEKTQQQIYGLGVFQIVTAHPQLEDPPLPEIPVQVSVKEAPRYRLKFGAGYGREDRFRVFTDTRTFGYLGRARHLRLYARRSELEPYHVRLTLTQPYFFHPRTAFEITPFARRQNERSFEARRIGAENRVSHVFTKYWSGNVDYVYEAVKLVGDSIPVALRLGDTSLTSYEKSSITLGTQFNNSTPVFSPDEGIFGAIRLTVSGLGFGSDFNFWRLLTEVRHYEAFLADVVLAVRAQVGGITQFSGSDFIPVEERLYSGGSLSVRGWDRHELGPKIDGVPVGGKSSFEANVEVRFPVWGMFSGAVFSDFGNVWLEAFTFKPGDLRYSAGVGVRASTPIGPIRLDVARPIFDEDDEVQIHINVGQAF